MGLYWQGVIHDLSKLSPTEFFDSAKYYSGDKSPTLAARIDYGYSKAWLAHKGRNKHHWEYWIDFVGGQIVPVRMPYKYIQEMVCDMIGAAKSYGNGSATEYYEKHKKNWFIENGTRQVFEELLEKWDKSKI